MTAEEDLPKAIWEGTFRVFGVDVRCFVLDDGQRIIEWESMHRLFEAIEAGAEPGADLEDFLRWRRQ